MRLKDLFTVPAGQKVTERHLGRVLVSSICSILLCMSCLAGSTWAWFTVSIVNSDNLIQIASVTPTVAITAGEGTAVASEDGSYSLISGTYSVKVDLTKKVTEADAFGAQSRPVYLVISVIRADDTSESHYIKVEYNCNSVTHKFIIGDSFVNISFAVSWVEPAAATLLEEENLVIGEIQTEEPTEESTETSTEEPTEETPGAPTETEGETEAPATEPSVENSEDQET